MRGCPNKFSSRGRKRLSTHEATYEAAVWCNDWLRHPAFSLSRSVIQDLGPGPRLSRRYTKRRYAPTQNKTMPATTHAKGILIGCPDPAASVGMKGHAN